MHEENQYQEEKKQKRRYGLAVPSGLMVGLAGALVLALSMNGTVAALTAKITNSDNTTGLGGGVTMQEFAYDSGGIGSMITTPVCDTANSPGNVVATCAYNKYGGNLNMAPGALVTYKVRIQNSSTTTAASLFTATFGNCTTTFNSGFTGTVGDLCAKVRLTIDAQEFTSGGTPVGTSYNIANDATATSLSGIQKILNGTGSIPSRGTLPPGNYVNITIGVKVDSTVDNTVLNQHINQTIAWEFTA